MIHPLFAAEISRARTDDLRRQADRVRRVRRARERRQRSKPYDGVRRAPAEAART